MTSPSLSRSLARFAVTLDRARLPVDTRENLKLFFLDWLSCLLAGRDEEAAVAVRAVFRDLGSAPQATLLGEKAGASVLFAACGNAVASHISEMDDVHRRALIHPSVPVAPAVLAVAEARNISGEDFLVALAAGTEIFIRVALGAGKSHYYYNHTTATCGIFGAAAGAGKVLGLSENQMAWALGTAGTASAGLWEFLADGAMSKQLHPGKAAMDGVFAALLAERDFTGTERILDGDKGLYRATSTDWDAEVVTRELGQTFLINEMTLKYHASCGHTHAALDALDAVLRGRRVTADEVRSITVRINGLSYNLLKDVTPDSPYMAKFHIPFCLALLAVTGRVGYPDFTPDTLHDPAVRALMPKVSVSEHAPYTEQAPRKWPAEVVVVFADGREERGYVEFHKGDPQNPLTREEVVAKFKELSGNTLSEEGKDALVERVFSLESLPSMRDFLAGIA